MGPFFDRSEAARLLAARLKAYRRCPGGIVLALPRGGVPVGAEVARALELPLDVYLVRKLGVPGHEELALGAVASGGVRVLNPEVMQAELIEDDVLEQITLLQREVLERRERSYRGDRPPLQLQDRTVILVDDGLATGATMRAAVRAVRRCHPRRVVVAVPVGARETVRSLEYEADDVVCVMAPHYFMSVGGWYQNFTQVSDDEVLRLLNEADGRGAEQPGAAAPPGKVGGRMFHGRPDGT